MAAGAALIAVAVLWPAPTRDPLRAAASGACRALAGRLRAAVAYLMSDRDAVFASERDQAVAQSDAAVAALHRTFLATPYRPTNLSTAARATVRLVDELNWLNAIVVAAVAPSERAPADHAACAVEVAAAAVLERGADLLTLMGGDCTELHAALAELSGAGGDWRTARRRTCRSRSRGVPGRKAVGAGVGEFITALDPSFHAQELGFAVSRIAENIDLTAAAERRSWLARLLGRQPAGLTGTFSAAQERASSHVARNSVWLHNSVRGAIALGVAVFVANRTRRPALLLGRARHAVGAALERAQHGTDRRSRAARHRRRVRHRRGVAARDRHQHDAPVVPAAGGDPVRRGGTAAISFAAGQAAFTLTLVFLFNIIQPAGWRVGLLRVEDIALGCAVSLVVGLLFWPRGAGAALRRALSDAYMDSADYLASAVRYGSLCCELGAAAAAPPLEDAQPRGRGGAATRRRLPQLCVRARCQAARAGRDDQAADRRRRPASRRRRRPRPVAPRGRLGGAATVRPAREELLQSSELVKRWYDELAQSLLTGRVPPQPLPHDRLADGRLLDAVRHDLSEQDGHVSATAVRMIWTGEHLDAVRRLQQVIVDSAQTASVPVNA